ncbi:MAG: hypothetical protein GWN58_00430, partial [Anaerolineae bacterium]|nr:hypothetical protein [Anaerolineae bacterium]
YQVRDYSTEVKIGDESPFCGQTLAETQLGEHYDLNVVQVRRDGSSLAASADLCLSAGDILVVSGAPDSILKASEAEGLEKVPELDGREELSDSHPRQLEMVEM